MQTTVQRQLRTSGVYVQETTSKPTLTRTASSIELLQDSWPKVVISQEETALEDFQSTEPSSQMKT